MSTFGCQNGYGGGGGGGVCVCGRWWEVGGVVLT